MSLQTWRTSRIKQKTLIIETENMQSIQGSILATSCHGDSVN